MSAALLALASTLASQGPQPLVLIPPPENEAECVLHERLAAVLDLIPDVRVVRAPRGKDEKLEAARVRLKADLALAREGGDLIAAGRSTKSAPIGNDSFAALAGVWPPGFPPLPEVHAMGAANADALLAACRNDAPAAYAASGPAIGSVVRARLDPPSSVNGRVLERWAQAEAAVRRGDNRRAVPVLKQVVDSLAHGFVGPVWRRSPASPPPTRISLLDDLLVAFEAGTFVALDPTSGEERWRATLGTAEPELVQVDHLLLALLETKIVALDPRNGKPSWTLDLLAPNPEIVFFGGRLFVSGSEQLLAIDPNKGDVLWKFDPLDDVTAGPTLVGTDLALPSSTFIHVINTADGAEKRKIDLKDEISSPLAVTAKGSLWALVGSDEVVLVDPQRGEITKRVTRFPGVEWPPAVGGERLAVTARRGRKTLLAILDPSTRSGIGRIFSGASSPVLSLPDYSGVVHPADGPYAVLARNFDGKPIWSARQRAPVSSLSTFSGVIAGATGTRAIMLDHQRGQLIQVVDLEGKIAEVAVGPKGGAAVLEKGTIYGLPAGNDPRPTRWLEQARMDLARAYVALGQRAPALALAHAVLVRNPHQLDARALHAQATEGHPTEAVVDWLDLIARAPKGDPLVMRAGEALRRLAGIEARLALDDPIEDLAVAGDQLLVLVKGTVTARALADPGKVLWSKPGKAIGAALDGFEIDGGFIDRAGKAGGRRAKEQRLAGGALFAVESGKANALSRLDAAGKPKWRQTFDAPTDMLTADQRFAMVGTDADGVQLLEVATGARKWLLPIGAHATGAWLGEETALVKSEKGFRGLALEDGKTRFDLSIPGETLAVATASGYLVASGRRAILVDERGKQRPIVMPGSIVALEPGFVALEDGTLAAIDLDRAIIAGRQKLGPFKRLVESAGRLIGLRTDGTVLVIDVRGKLKGPG